MKLYIAKSIEAKVEKWIELKNTGLNCPKCNTVMIYIHHGIIMSPVVAYCPKCTKYFQGIKEKEETVDNIVRI